MILAAMSLFQREGYAAASWRRIVQESGAPWGSAHHYFPKGKEQLGLAALEMASQTVAASMARCFPEGGVAADGVRQLFEGGAKLLTKSGFTAGCPICTVALETAPQSPTLTETCNSAFQLWRQTIADGLVRCGMSAPYAAKLAVLALAAFEGALVQARTAQSQEPMLDCATMLEQLCREPKSGA
ncbi:TetR/AcrR family transcriptional regulator [Phenylobacterium aquaticum]|uniref:TetR/AcrR family transcriptional regulator n=1 Tax=Phenylobacterium aquaticum TaxID=1763816 RepID=UPI0026EF0B19|nr:TetR/AcrR family transcriptional regulator [Phenylobacterium aquaticum]